MVRIVTDSSTLITAEEAEKMGIDMIPLCVTIGDMEGRDLAVDMDEFYGRIAKGEIPRSSQPPIGDVVDVYEKYPDDEIINISMADGLSGTYQTACGAKEIVDNGENVTVINTQTLCGPHRYMVEKAQEMKLAGKSAKEIIDWVNGMLDKTESFLIPQDFSFLKRGGRLTPMAAAFGSVLKLKPIMTLTEDRKRLDKYAIKRTLPSSVKAIIERMQKNQVGENHIVYVVHANALEDANKVIAQIKEAIPSVEIRMHDLSPVFVTQGGPSCIAIQYIER